MHVPLFLFKMWLGAESLPCPVNLVQAFSLKQTPVRDPSPGDIAAHKTNSISLYWFPSGCWISAVPLNGPAGSCAWCHVVLGIMCQCSVRSLGWAGCHNGEDHVAARGMSSLCDTGLWPTKTSFHTHHLLGFLNWVFWQCPKLTKNPTWKPSSAQWGKQCRAQKLQVSGLSSVGHGQRCPSLKEGTAELGVPTKNLLVSHQPLECGANSQPLICSGSAWHPRNQCCHWSLHPGSEAAFTFCLVIREKKYPSMNHSFVIFAKAAAELIVYYWCN